MSAAAQSGSSEPLQEAEEDGGEPAEYQVEALAEDDTREYFEQLGELMGYDGAIPFEPMSEYSGGFHKEEFSTGKDGYLQLEDTTVVLNDHHLDDAAQITPTNPAEPYTDDVPPDARQGYLMLPGNLFEHAHHEFAHEVQTDILRDYNITTEEWDALEWIREGQVSYNTREPDADAATPHFYDDAHNTYEEILEHYDAGMDPGEAVEAGMEGYAATYLLDDGNGVDVQYLVQADDQEDAREWAERMANWNDMEVVDEDVINYDQFDTDKLGEYLFDVQDALDERYDRIRTEYGNDHVPEPQQEAETGAVTMDDVEDGTDQYDTVHV